MLMDTKERGTSQLLQDLVAVREGLTDPKNWGQRTFKSGNKCCVVGKLIQVQTGQDNPEIAEAIDCWTSKRTKDFVSAMCDVLNEHQNLVTIYVFNDTHSHQEVLDALDKTILAETAKLKEFA